MELSIDLSNIDGCCHTFPCLRDKVNNLQEQIVYIFIICANIFSHSSIFFNICKQFFKFSHRSTDGLALILDVCHQFCQ